MPGYGAKIARRKLPIFMACFKNDKVVEFPIMKEMALNHIGIPEDCVIEYSKDKVPNRSPLNGKPSLVHHCETVSAIIGVAITYSLKQYCSIVKRCRCLNDVWLVWDQSLVTILWGICFMTMCQMQVKLNKNVGCVVYVTVNL